MSSSDLDKVKRFYELVNTDASQLPEVLDAEIQWEIIEGFPYGGKYNGLNSVFEDFFGRVLQHFDGWQAEPKEFISGDEKITVLGTYHTKAKESGQDIDSNFAHIWSVKNGKLTRLQQYADTVQISKALNNQVPEK